MNAAVDIGLAAGYPKTEWMSTAAACYGLTDIHEYICRALHIFDGKYPY